jgi:hypothetical protein
MRMVFVILTCTSEMYLDNAVRESVYRTSSEKHMLVK